MHPLLRPISEEQFKTLTKRELVVVARGEQQIRLQMQAELERLEALKKELEDQIIKIDGNFVTIRNRLFGESSEKSIRPKPKPVNRKKKNRATRGKSTKLPSERYPNVEVVEKVVGFEQVPPCRACNTKMAVSSMGEVSEYLTVVPKQFLIVRQFRQKYRCECCHGDVQTAPSLPRIKPGSSYSDELIIDVALSKYCDLIPIERYCAMATRQGVPGLPPNSLIAGTHHLADFVAPAVEKVKAEVLAARVIHADETPHRMLEGDDKQRWFLWGFSAEFSAYFECHDTRSGDVAVSILIESQCEVLVTDVFSGYKKAVSVANVQREAEERPPIEKSYCNAHARRRFKEAEVKFPEESSYYLSCYRKIYKLETRTSEGPEQLSIAREEARPIFDEMAEQAEKDLELVSSQSLLAKALKYFLNNLNSLKFYLNHSDVPIDNNRQERVLRNPVIGRKTWYGTHSKRGARTAAALFTLVESCKLAKVNPREYFPELIRTLHAGKSAFTPTEYQKPPPQT